MSKIKIGDIVKDLEKLALVQEKLNQAEGRESKGYRQAYPPASEFAIRALEKKLKFRFPPSYRAFLNIHNGWKGFHNDVAVFGVSGIGYTRPVADFNQYLKMLQKGPKTADESADALRKKEQVDEKTIYLPDHVPLATDFNGIYWVFDRNRKRKDGEYPIAEVLYGQNVEFRTKNFLEFVKRAIAQAQNELESEKKSHKGEEKRQEKMVEQRKRKFDGKMFVFAGTLAGMNKKDALDYVKEAGGIVSNTLDKKTSYSVFGNGKKDGKRVIAAKKLGVRVLAEQQFYDLLFKVRKKK